MFYRLSLFIVFLVCSIPAYSFTFFQNSTDNNQQEVLVKTIVGHTEGLSPQVLSLALTAYDKLHAEGYDQQQILTVVDYTKPSTEPRLWVINLKNQQVLYRALVAHGENSGANYASSFSDDPRSLESSLGVYLTDNAYVGNDGYSLRLDGLDKGYNDKAKARDIVVHAANYVSNEFAALHGRLGRSWGCFALNPMVADSIIGNIKNGTVLFAYYPDKSWLDHSVYLQAA